MTLLDTPLPTSFGNITTKTLRTRLNNLSWPQDSTITQLVLTLQAHADEPLTLDKFFVGISGSGGSFSSVQPVKVGGATSFTIPAGQEVVCDPVNVSWATPTAITVSGYCNAGPSADRAAAAEGTAHVSYLRNGDFASTVSDTGFLTYAGYQSLVSGLDITYEAGAPASKRVISGLGQSNCVRLFSEGGSAMQAACPVPLRQVSSAVNASSYAQWAPGSAYLNNAIAAYNAAMQEADTEHGAFIFYRGENESSVQADAASLPELWAASIEAFRSGVGKSDLPVIIPVLFAKPTDNRPYWASVQGSQIAMTTPHMAGLIPFSHGVSFADLVGTLDDGVHMAPAQNATAGTRVGQALSTILTL